MAGHVSPEAAVGGPIAAVRNGDQIVFDIEKRELSVDVDSEELSARLKKWQAPEPLYRRGVFRKYVDRVSSASLGAVTT